MNQFFINDLFWTFQGEGKNWGRRALFIRMPYCNLKCSWCDTEFNSFQKVSENELENKIKEEPSKFAVITGGEPTMNKQVPTIISILKKYEFEIAIESNGHFPIPDWVDFITVSPKRDGDYFIHKDAAMKCSELKVVVDDGFDFSILDGLAKQVKNDCILTLSPEFTDMSKSISKIEEFIKINPLWKLSLQTHKWIGVK